MCECLLASGIAKDTPLIVGRGKVCPMIPSIIDHNIICCGSSAVDAFILVIAYSATGGEFSRICRSRSELTFQKCSIQATLAIPMLLPHQRAIKQPLFTIKKLSYKSAARAHRIHLKSAQSLLKTTQKDIGCSGLCNHPPERVTSSPVESMSI